MKEHGTKKSQFSSFIIDNQAFTLIEIMVTIVIFAFIVIVFSSSIINNIKLIDISGDKIIKLNEVRTNINKKIAKSVPEEISDTEEIIFNKGKADEKRIYVDVNKITESVNYKTLNGNSSVSLNYFRPVISE